MGRGSAEERRFYDLWWQYLGESEGYKTWLNESLDDYLSSTAPEANIQPNEVRTIRLPERFKSPQQRRWIDLYARYGDIRSLTFEEWFENIKPVLPIEDYTDRVQEDIDACWMYCYHDMRDKEERQESIKAGFEYADILKDQLMKRWQESDLLHVVIDPDADINTVKTLLKKMMKQRKKRREQIYFTKRKYRLAIAGRIRLDEIDQYLEVYRRAKPYIGSGRKVRWEEMADNNTRNSANSPDDARRIHDRYLEKALRIIRNVEDGLFPGKY